MNKKYGILLLMLTPINFALAELKDPMLRDEDILKTQVEVEVSQSENGLYIYEYRLTSPQDNIGIVQSFSLDIECDYQFDDYIRPDDTSLINVGDLSEDGQHVPASITADYGQSSTIGISWDNKATWGLIMKPGQQRRALKLVTPAEPGFRQYVLAPSFRKDYEWDYAKYEFQEDVQVPWIPDFTVTGIVEGPGCPDDNSNGGEYSGNILERAESDEDDRLLTYSAPLKDRFHLPKGESLEMTIHYSNEIDPKSFKVEPPQLRRFFKPEPGGSESVILPLKKPRNKIKLQVNGMKERGKPEAPGQGVERQRDTDRFEIRLN